MSETPTGPFSESVLEGQSVPMPVGVDRRLPEQIGSYRVLELLGEGGMGEVYKAERREPIRQTVAIKVIKLGMNSREIVGRFESERQALALMDHPAIARVLDAGTTLSGQPYFVMDLVQGKPITVFCDEHRLSIDDRLLLFCELCDAISHAHTKAIIHRDMKPSNVLAFYRDNVAALKVIDFGIAKALSGGRLTEMTVNTVQGHAIGTYEYMSPEQVEGSPDIDTRTDVYSLGVLLYELLTGAKPFDGPTLSRSTEAEIKRIIRDVEPPRPSTRLSGMNKLSTSLAECRKTSVDGLTRRLKSELEWIPLMAMRKERARRYSSPAQLSEDIRNYLAGHPLLAGPESRVYRARKFVRRNRTALIAYAIVSALAIGGVAFYVQSIRAEQQRTEFQKLRAEAALKEAEAQRDRAVKQAEIANGSSSFLSQMLASANPEKSLGREMTVTEMLDDAIASIDRGKGNADPETEAVIRYTVGSTFRTLGHFDKALPQLRRAVELGRSNTSPTFIGARQSKMALALLLLDMGNLVDAEMLFREVLANKNNDLPTDAAELSTIESSLALVLWKQGKLEEAEALQRRVLATRRRVLPANDLGIATTFNNLAAVLQSQNKLEDAEGMYREALQIRRAALPGDHPAIATTLSNLGTVLADENKFEAAEPIARESLEIRKRILPATHPLIEATANLLARVLVGVGKQDEAEQLLREFLAQQRAALGESDPAVANSMTNLGMFLLKAGKTEESETIYREAIAISRAAPSRNEANYANQLSGFGRMLVVREKFAEAEQPLREAIEIRTRLVGPKATATKTSAGFLVTALEKLNRHTEADSLREQVGLPAATTRPQ